jgi:V/A-type H+-transporting ATPase subunit C
VLENRLLTMEKLSRMSEAENVSDLIRILGEYGYGGSAADYRNALRIAPVEMQTTYNYVRHVTPNEMATNAMLLKGDCHNLKCVLKSLLLHRDAKPLLRDYGTINSDKLHDSVYKGDVSLLPPHMQKAASQALRRIELGHAEVQWVECLVDAACFADMADFAKQSGEPAAVQFVAVSADLTNVVTLLRIKATGGNIETLGRALLPGGTVDTARFVSQFDKGTESLLIHLGLRRYQSALGSGIDAADKDGSFGLLERQCDDILIRLMRQKRYDREGVAPLLSYLLAKEREAQAVRLLIVAKNNAVPQTVIQERLRELYA